MRCLLVTDSDIKSNALGCSLRKAGSPKQVDIVSLASVSSAKNLIYDELSSAGVIDISNIEIAKEVHSQVVRLRNGIGSWATNIGNTMVNGKNVRDWFLLPSLGVSAWWFSLLAERNTGKSDVFLKIAQVRAIEEILQEGAYECVFIAVGSPGFRESLENLAKRMGVQATVVRTSRNRTIGRRTRDLLENSGLIGAVVLGLGIFARFIARGVLVRWVLGPRSRRLSKERSILFVTCFPMVDQASAKRGFFVNRYAEPLQDMFRKTGRNIFWLLMTQPLEGYSFRRSVALAKRLIAGGERMCLLEEYLTVWGCFVALWLWVRQSFVARRIYRHIRDKVLLVPPIGEECEPLISPLWDASFCGIVGMEGILYALAYHRVFTELKNATHCIYYAEMHAWERALNAARRSVAPLVKTIGYQHAMVPKNLFNYFCDPRETLQQGLATDIPLPDVFACCGDRLREQFEPCGYPNLKLVEAVRYLYLEELLSSPVPRKAKRPLLLVAGSSDRDETRSTLAMLYQAFPRSDQFDIVCKGHPCVPLNTIFSELGIDPEVSGYVISGDLVQCLGKAWAVLVPSSGVSIEALAFGCEVIVPIFPNTITMNPVAEFDGYCHLAASSDDIVKAMERILQGETFKMADEKREFVMKYWCIDKKLTRWTELLADQGVS